jgi:DNA replication protein DnaC
MKNNIGGLIGKRKYEALKALDLENITEESMIAFEMQFKNLTIAEAIKKVKDYEDVYVFNLKSEKATQYFEDLNSKKEEVKKIIMTKEWLWERFYKSYKENEGDFYSKENDSIENIKPLIYYFIGDYENFAKCKNVSLISKPSLEKGFLVVGGYGNGKTSVMKALSSSLKGTNISFRSKSTNDIVSEYEACAKEFDKVEFWNSMTKGDLNFDDLLTEREASNYGKINIFKDVIEKRYDHKKRTYASLNYDDNHPNDLEKALDQIATKYGSRAYDRVFSMFNVIEFTGKSYRK